MKVDNNLTKSSKDDKIKEDDDKNLTKSDEKIEEDGKSDENIPKGTYRATVGCQLRRWALRAYGWLRPSWGRREYHSRPGCDPRRSSATSKVLTSQRAP